MAGRTAWCAGRALTRRATRGPGPGEPLDNLTHSEHAIAAFEQATGRSRPRPAPPTPPLIGTAAAPPPIPPTGFTVEAAAPPGGLARGAVLKDRTVLYLDW